MNKLRTWLQDPFLKQLYGEIRKAGPIRSVSIDLTDRCNIRCEGCYYFSENMDRYASPDEEGFDSFIRRELKRGTNFVTVVGGEPTLRLDRLKKIHRHFRMNVSTNGLIPIPRKGFETMPIGVSVWGDHDTDRAMRGGGKLDIFRQALKNYRNDPRAFFYFTVSPGNSHMIEPVVDECVANGNRILFNFYSDLSDLGGNFNHQQGFEKVHLEIRKMIRKYPHMIYTTSYLSEVVTTGRLYDQRWGYEVCTTLSVDYPGNRVRFRNGNPYSSHFNAYNADLMTPRRCCTGIDRSCDSCLDVWQHFSWIMINMKKHMGSKKEFTRWLTTMYVFYLINRMVDFEKGLQWLPEIHSRTMQSKRVSPQKPLLTREVAV